MIVFQASLALCILGPADSDMALLAPTRDTARAVVLANIVVVVVLVVVVVSGDHGSSLRRRCVGGEGQ